MLAVSRAIGETMAVTMAMGMSPQMPYFPNVLRNLAESSQTMTAAMVQIANSDIAGGTLAYKSLFAIGLTLFAITLLMNIVSNVISERYREEY